MEPKTDLPLSLSVEWWRQQEWFSHAGVVKVSATIDEGHAIVWRKQHQCIVRMACSGQLWQDQPNPWQQKMVHILFNRLTEM